jgi:formiminotetrahydrofolate cyclodeaminase
MEIFINYRYSIESMITTIQIHKKVKDELDSLKTKNKESYEEIILALMKTVEEQKRQEKELLIEGYKEMAEESLKINKEFEAIEEDFDWKW